MPTDSTINDWNLPLQGQPSVEPLRTTRRAPEVSASSTTVAPMQDATETVQGCAPPEDGGVLGQLVLGHMELLNDLAALYALNQDLEH